MVEHDFGPSVCIQESCLIWGAQHLRIGKRVHIGRGTEIMADGGVTIGDNVVISYDCVLWSIDHRYEGERLPYDGARIRRPISINDNVWIGRNSIVRGGVTVGEGAVVAIGSVVTADIPPLAVVGGNPARVLKFRDRARYLRLKAENRLLWEDPAVCGACRSDSFFLVDFAENGRGLQRSPMSALSTFLRHLRWRCFRR